MLRAERTQNTENYAASNESKSSLSVKATNGELPDLIKVAIPIFRGGTTFEIEGRLRIHTGGDSLSVSYRLVNLDRAVEKQIEDWRTEISEKTGLFVHR